MSIATSLAALQTAKTDIATAITNKGGTVNQGDGMSDFATDIGTIPTGSEPVIQSLNVSANGTYTAPDGVDGYSPVTVNTDPAKGLVFENYDSDGYPTSLRFVGMTTIQEGMCRSYLSNYKFGKNISSVVVPEGIIGIAVNSFSDNNALTSVSLPSTLKTLGNLVFSACSNLKTISLPEGLETIGQECFMNNYFLGSLNGITIPASIVSIGPNAFNNCYRCTRVSFSGQAPNILSGTFGQLREVTFDFSNCTSIPSLANTISLGINTYSRTIIIPSELSDSVLGEGNGWESQTNWVALDNITWEVV